MRVAWLLLAALLSTLVGAAPVLAAEVCYQDPNGRIVQRRRPGYTRVTCPSASAQAPEIAPSETRSPEATVGEAVRSEIVQPAVRPYEPPYEQEPRRAPIRQPNPVSPVPRPGREAYTAAVPMPDRWRIVDALGYDDRWWDPYNRNVLKADKPVSGGDWFFNIGVISDTFAEYRDVPTPVGSSSTGSAGSLDVFGSDDQWAMNQNLATEFVYYKGDTVYRPPDLEFRFTPVFNWNRTELDEVLGVSADPRDGKTRNDHHVGIQAAFVDAHLRNVSDRYDFDSIRFGIQPFSSDFRGFLFQDNQLGLRLFGTRDNNVRQYNLAWFRRLEKDINSGLNDVGEGLRDDDVLVANLYWQDLPVRGFTSQFTVLYNRNREDDFHRDSNGFTQRPASLGQARPRHYDIGYLGYSGDGHFRRFNVTGSLYYAFGEEDPGVFDGRQLDVSALFGAIEVSADFDWMRPRLSFLYGSGDDDPFDDEAHGFDAIFENPQFAGADTSYWIRQSLPLVGGGQVGLSGRNGVLASLRSSKEQGQSNFTNPGIWLVGGGADLDVLPELRVSFNWNYLRFDDTSVLEVARAQADIDSEIGHDVSMSVIYRPFMSQNVVLRASYAVLISGQGYEDLYPDKDPGYFMFNMVLAF